jgi:hypothetical protein
MKHRLKKISMALSCLFLMVGNSALAQTAVTDAPADALLHSDVVVNLGSFIYNTNVKASLNGRSVTNPDIDFDDTFGKDKDSTRARLDALWRINPNHHLHFQYFDNTTTRTRALDKTINWGDSSYQAGATVQAKFKTTVANISYEYAFMHTPTYEITASAGVHYMDISLGLSGTASVTDANGKVTQGTFSSKQASTPAPLPVIGLRGAWVVAPNWYLDAHVQSFKVKIGDIDGNWTDLGTSATWMYNRNFGLGLGYNRFSAKLDAKKVSFNGTMRMSYGGFQLFATGAF